MDFLDALQPHPPYDATVTLPHAIDPPEGDPAAAGAGRSLADLDQLATVLHDLRLDCLRLARRRHEVAFTIVGHNEIAALNARLVTVQALNLLQRPYHRSSSVTAWPAPPLPTNVLMSPADLIPYLTDALAVLGARQRLLAPRLDGLEPVDGELANG